MPPYLAPLAISTLGLGTLVGIYLLLVDGLQQPDTPIPSVIPPALLPYLEPTALALVGVLMREKYYCTLTWLLKAKEAAAAAAAVAAEWGDAALARFGAVLLAAQQAQASLSVKELEEGTATASVLAALEWAGHGAVRLGRFVLHAEPPIAADAAAVASAHGAGSRFPPAEHQRYW